MSDLKIVNPVSKTLTAVPEAIGNLWAHRGLIRNFTSRDISQRYRNSIIGYFWTVLEPLLLSAVYYFLFTIISGNPEERYPLWIILGVVTWQFFSKGLNESVKRSETKFQLSIRKSRYLNTPSSERFVTKLMRNHRLRRACSSVSCIFRPAVQSMQVEISNKMRCQPEASQKKT